MLVFDFPLQYDLPNYLLVFFIGLLIAKPERLKKVYSCLAKPLNLLLLLAVTLVTMPGILPLVYAETAIEWIIVMVYYQLCNSVFILGAVLVSLFMLQKLASLRLLSRTVTLISSCGFMMFLIQPLITMLWAQLFTGESVAWARWNLTPIQALYVIPLSISTGVITALILQKAYLSLTKHTVQFLAGAIKYDERLRRHKP